MAMDKLRGIWSRLHAIWHRGAAEQELNEELRFHIERETEAGVSRGLTPAEARRRALVQSGGVERYREESRDARGLNWWDEARSDLRHGWRLLVAHPVFAGAAILTLALGTGANTAIFSVVNTVLLQPSPFRDPDRLVMLWETDRGSGTHHEPASWPDVADFRERSHTLSAIGSVMGADVTITGDGDPLRVAALDVTPNLLTMLGISPVEGRLFRPDEGSAGGARVAVLGEGFWRAHFNGDRGVIGRTISVDGEPTTVVGVAPEAADLGIRQVHERADYAANFSGEHVDLWIALQPSAPAFGRQTHPFLTLGRLAPGATFGAAQTELASISSDLEHQYQVNANRGVNLERYSDVVFGSVRPALLMLLAAVTLVLLVTCANVANLLLGRTATRSREVALRRALGAGPGRLNRQFLAESLLLVVLGSGAGVAMAVVGLRSLVALAPADIPRLDSVSVNGTVLAYAIGIAALVAVVFGVLPALQMRRIDIQQTLKAHGAGRVAGSRGTRRFRAALVVSEVAAAVLLVVGAGLLVRSLWSLQAVNPGFSAARVLKAQYQLPSTRYPIDYSKYPDAPAIQTFNSRVLAAVQAIPGVESAALAAGSPLDPGFTNSWQIIGREAESAKFPEIRVRVLSPDYLKALDVPVLEGRGIEASDDASAPQVVVINHTAAQRYFPHGAVGQQVRWWGITRRIVGVIGDEKFRGIDAPTDPAAYAPAAQVPLQSVTLLARTSSADPTVVAGAIRQAVHAIDPQIALYGVESLQHTEAASIAKPRFNALLLAVFAGLAIVLAVVGVHGVLSYAVTERAPEMGIRMALGASRQNILRAVVGEGMALAGLGVTVGLAGAFVGSRLLASMLFGVTTTDPVTFVVVPLVVLLTAAAASLLPALRATRVDPMQVLRAE
jgi:putative ABC transport system permease protein